MRKDHARPHTHTHTHTHTYPAVRCGAQCACAWVHVHLCAGLHPLISTHLKVFGLHREAGVGTTLAELRVRACPCLRVLPRETTCMPKHGHHTDRTPTMLCTYIGHTKKSSRLESSQTLPRGSVFRSSLHWLLPPPSQQQPASVMHAVLTFRGTLCSRRDDRQD